jgi:hypothetical protein
MHMAHPLDRQDRTHFDHDIDIVRNLLRAHKRHIDPIKCQLCRQLLRIPAIQEPNLAKRWAFQQKLTQKGDILVDAIRPNIGSLCGRDRDTNIEFFHEILPL